MLDIDANVGLQWMQAADGYPPWEPAAPLRVFLHWFYSARGMRLCHAGTLGKNGCGVLLGGSGGSGKSGTVVGGVLNGLKTVGDDYVVIDGRGERAIAYPVFTTMKQDAAGLKRLGLDTTIARTGGANWQGKFEFSCQDHRQRIRRFARYPSDSDPDDPRPRRDASRAGLES